MGWKIGTFVCGAAALVGAYFGILGCVMSSKDTDEVMHLRERNAQLVKALETSLELNKETFPRAVKALQYEIETS